MWWFWWFLEPIGAFARWIGERLGASVAGVAGETEYLAQRARTASPAERSAWLFRCTISCLIVAGEWILLALLHLRSDHPLALLVVWVAVLLLPKPTPRIPLVLARILAVVFTMTNLAALYDSAKAKIPGLDAYSAIVGFCGFAIWIALSAWALLGVRVSSRVHPSPFRTET
jgi:hypothetical protein